MINIKLNYTIIESENFFYIVEQINKKNITEALINKYVYFYYDNNFLNYMFNNYYNDLYNIKYSILLYMINII